MVIFFFFKTGVKYDNIIYNFNITRGPKQTLYERADGTCDYYFIFVLIKSLLDTVPLWWQHIIIIIFTFNAHWTFASYRRALHSKQYYIDKTAMTIIIIDMRWRFGLQVLAYAERAASRHRKPRPFASKWYTILQWYGKELSRENYDLLLIRMEPVVRENNMRCRPWDNNDGSEGKFALNR